MNTATGLLIFGIAAWGWCAIIYLLRLFREGNEVERDRLIYQEVARTLTEVQAEAAAERRRERLGPPHLPHIRGTAAWAEVFAEHVVPDGRNGPVIYTPASTREERVVREVLASRYLELRPARSLRWLNKHNPAWDYRRDYVVRTIGSPKQLPPR